MSTRAKLLLSAGGVLGLMIVLGVALGSTGMNNEFQPQNEFKLDPWVKIKIGVIDLSITKAVLYLIIASILTVVTMTWVARRMQQKPNRVQTAVEVAYTLMRDNITGGNMDREMAVRWFSFVATIFLFIWFSNILGYIPLPTSTEHKVTIFGAHLPSFALYAATANISVTLVLSLTVWLLYHYIGVRAQGPIGYLKSWLPAGTPRGPLGLGYAGIFLIETISQFVRLISLSVRLFANILAGHLLILFMGGGLVVLLGIAALGPLTFIVGVAFFMFEVVLIATLQAFIFATLTAIYFGGAAAAHH
jgi:F-type H+-transporting ATPase subunit a